MCKKLLYFAGPGGVTKGPFAQRERAIFRRKAVTGRAKSCGEFPRKTAGTQSRENRRTVFSRDYIDRGRVQLELEWWADGRGKWGGTRVGGNEIQGSNALGQAGTCAHSMREEENSQSHALGPSGVGVLIGGNPAQGPCRRKGHIYPFHTPQPDLAIWVTKDF